MAHSKGESHYLFGKHLPEETKAKIRASVIETLKNPEIRKKLGDSHRGKPQKSIEKMSGENNHGWQGGISKLPYCKLWNASLKERVRIFFSYQCVECGTPQGKKKLDVHHIHYDKKSCCNNEAPRMFVALCHSCHTKTEVNRSYWEEHFTEIIQKYYQGKCFFTKEEMAQFQEMI
jgi:5-methylcytosine-specific restriction endonuclease McrA